jgi:hypothetical protein
MSERIQVFRVRLLEAFSIANKSQLEAMLRKLVTCAQADAIERTLGVATEVGAIPTTYSTWLSPPSFAFQGVIDYLDSDDLRGCELTCKRWNRQCKEKWANYFLLLHPCTKTYVDPLEFTFRLRSLKAVRKLRLDLQTRDDDLEPDPDVCGALRGMTNLEELEIFGFSDISAKDILEAVASPNVRSLRIDLHTELNEEVHLTQLAHFRKCTLMYPDLVVKFDPEKDALETSLPNATRLGWVDVNCSGLIRWIADAQKLTALCGIGILNEPRAELCAAASNSLTHLELERVHPDSVRLLSSRHMPVLHTLKLGYLTGAEKAFRDFHSNLVNLYVCAEDLRFARLPNLQNLYLEHIDGRNEDNIRHTVDPFAGQITGFGIKMYNIEMEGVPEVFRVAVRCTKLSSVEFAFPNLSKGNHWSGLSEVAKGIPCLQRIFIPGGRVRKAVRKSVGIPIVTCFGFTMFDF